QACNGGGIDVNAGSPLIQGNTITQNIEGGCSGGTMGGGIFIQGASNAQIIGNTISNNPYWYQGGGIALDAAGSPLIQNNIISGNQASSGGGIVEMNQTAAIIVQN